MGTTVTQAINASRDCSPRLSLINLDSPLTQVLALAFADPRGLQGLMEVLTQAQRKANPTASFIQTMAILQTLDWLQHHPPTPLLLHALQRSPALQNTLLSERLKSLEQSFQTHQVLPAPYRSDEPSPEEVFLQILYCLMSTPTDFALVVKRSAQRLNYHPDALILAAGLVGFANGLGQLPLQWRFALQSLQWSVATPLEEQLFTFANMCSAQWAGCYRPWLFQSRLIIAPPGQLRPR
jgi:hypothetical protein